MPSRNQLNGMYPAGNMPVKLKWDKPSFDKAFAELEKELTSVVRGMTVMMWNSILIKTPQFYGRMAASWSYSIGSPEYYDRSSMVEHYQIDSPASYYIDREGNDQFGGLWRGHPAAIAIANDDNIGSDKKFKLGNTVYISNGVDHGEGYYAADVEQINIPLRQVNMPSAPLSRTVSMIEAKYGSGISARSAVELKNLRIGG